MKCYLGIDTSCYVTSVAVVAEDETILFHGRTPLHVELGGRGLRQQEAVFAHIQNLPALVEQAFQKAEPHTLAAVGVSAFPRDVPGSYMPVFLAGETVAKSIAAALHIPVYPFSHQQGHLRAGQVEGRLQVPYLAVHLSGGTTEILAINEDIMLLGGTLDISAGQLIDRAGVAMGMHFPAGRELEALAWDAKEAAPFSVTTKGCDMHFSGAETQFLRMLPSAQNRADMALGLFQCVGKTLGRACGVAMQQTHIQTLLVVGGVAVNHFVQEALCSELHKHIPDGQVYFAPPAYAGDNAVGTAFLAKEHFYAE